MSRNDKEKVKDYIELYLTIIKNKNDKEIDRIEGN